jgi:hypothetical protein
MPTIFMWIPPPPPRNKTKKVFQKLEKHFSEN